MVMQSGGSYDQDISRNLGRGVLPFTGISPSSPLSLSDDDNSRGGPMGLGREGEIDAVGEFSTGRQQTII